MVLVWLVFRDPALDVRMVVVGALAPDLIDGASGRPVFHSVVVSAVLLALVMVSTRGRRRMRRRLLGLPIGVFLHLVLDGAWTASKLFWWPAFGSWGSGTRIPSLDRPLAVVVLQEAVGLLAIAWCWRTFGLADRLRREAFFGSGRLEAISSGP